MYKSALNLLETEIAIKYIKDTFEVELAKALKLTRVSAPLFVAPETGLNDNLNGYERAVRFDVLTLNKEVEIVQSLAKWKRMALSKYGFESEEEKVLIVCPRPQNMSAVDGGRLHDIDSGDRVGDAKLFSAEGFLRAIELDNLDM